MSFRTLSFLLFISIVFGVPAAHAQIKVTSAYYGRLKPEKTIDVTETVQALANAGRTSFRVGEGTFRVYPNPGRPNFLVVQYYAYGRNYTGRAEDGEFFTFKGGAAGPATGTTRLRFENGYSRVVYLYELNRWGAWGWKAQLDAGSNYSTDARPGEKWAVTDRSGRLLQQVVVPSNGGTVRLR
jgi:hypothetical protein